MDLTSWPSGKPNYTPQLWCLEPGTCFPTPGLKREDWRRQASYIGLLPSCQPCPISVSILAWFHPGSLRPLDPFLRPRRGAGREGWGGCPRRGAGREGWGGGCPRRIRWLDSSWQEHLQGGVCRYTPLTSSRGPDPTTAPPSCSSSLFLYYFWKFKGQVPPTTRGYI